MLFNTIEFLIFMFLAFVFYWSIQRFLKIQNLYLLALSYFFYGWWDYRFLGLIIFSSLVDYFSAIQISNSSSPKRKKAFLVLSLITNIGLLGFFKYFNFFIENFIGICDLIGINTDVHTLSIILPVGISFYTFQTISYTIDVYRGEFNACRNPITFLTYVSFFPQLVAGPIERAKNLLPQFDQSRVFNYELAKDGLRQILWGLFTKIVIADNCATLVNSIFGAEDYGSLGSVTLLFGGVFFAFQIYSDFSGYSNIAIGTAKLFGFSLMTNFSTPFFSKSVTEFWRRWHISLSFWFNDYVFTPFVVAKRDWGTRGVIVGLFLTFVLSGLWHGAAWTFVFYGFLQGLALVVEFLLKKKRKKWAKAISPLIYNGGSILLTFTFSVFTMILFRSESISRAFSYIYAGFTHIQVGFFSIILWVKEPVFIFIVIMMFLEFIYKNVGHGLSIQKLPIYLRWPIYYLLILCIIFFGNYKEEIDFIYFQF